MTMQIADAFVGLRVIEFAQGVAAPYCGLLLGRNGAKTAAVMQNFAASGHFTLDADVMERAYALFSAYRLDDAGTVAEIATTAKNDGMVLDPHSAVGLSAARRAR